MRGRQDAARLEPRLRGLGFSRVYSSPLQRALQTGALAGYGEPVQTPLLREVDYGEYEGLTSAEIRRRRPGWELYRDGSPGGESPAQILARAREFLTLALEPPGANPDPDPDPDPEARVLAFSHGHFIRALAVAFLGLEIEHAGLLGLDTASLSVLHQGERGRLLQVWNS